MVNVFTFHLPTKLIVGAGSLSQLGDEAAALGKRALIVTYPDIRRIGLLEKVTKLLNDKGVTTLTFEKVEPNPRSTTIDEGGRMARDEKIDLVIGLGGGSAMDAAKAIALASTGTKPIWSYVGVFPIVPETPVPPTIQIATMAGTGAELNAASVITNWDTHEKNWVYTPLLLAKVTIVDPELTLTLPERQTKAGGIDIFTHLAEAYITDRAVNPLTDGIRETVMKLVVTYLPQAIAKPNDIEARSQLSWASTMAMSSLSRLGGGSGALTSHSIEHALSGYYDVIHGEGLAALLPAWMKHTYPVAKDRFESLGKNVFGQADAVRATEQWLESVGMRLRSGDLGCKREDAELIADLTLKSSPTLNLHPSTMDAEVIAKIYLDSF